MTKLSRMFPKATLTVGFIAFSFGLVSSCAAPTAVPNLGISSSPKVLMIGDSLTVGPFGDRMEAWLIRTFGASNASIYASCGSSPEHWLAAEKTFVTPCGYRETKNGKRVLEKHRNGRKPRKVSTPKIETLLARHRPEIVIIQLGTNHFDNLAQEGKSAIPGLARHYDQFANALRKKGSSVRLVVWIAPPDSSKFPKWIQDTVEGLISGLGRRYHFGTIYSRKFTNYRVGRTGSDGVHYDDSAAYAWANEVIGRLSTGFRKIGAMR
jgi:hypothetical protein